MLTCFLQQLRSPSTFHPSDQPLLKFSHLWYCLIEDYSRRGLTQGSDKLIALAGLVQEAQEHINLRYCVGIWLDMVHTELSWVVREDEQAASRATTYRAPTWSWASIDGAVVPVASYRGSNTHVKHEIRSEIDLLDSSVKVTNDGRIASAHIHLCGRLRPQRLSLIGGARAPTVFRFVDDAPGSSSNPKGSGEIWLDPRPLDGSLAPTKEDSIAPSKDDEATLQEYQQPSSVTYQLLHVCTRQWHDRDRGDDNTAPNIRTLYEVLALEPIKGREAEFVRVGAGAITLDSWFEEQPIQRIKIF